MATRPRLPGMSTGLDVQVATGLPSAGSPGGGDEAGAAYAAFTRLAAGFGAWADDQARAEGERAGAVAGLDPGFVSQGSSTIRGKAYDKAGEAAFLAQSQASFASDAMDIAQQHKDDPAAFKTAYDGLTARYAQRVQAAGPHLMGDFTTRATQLGTQLRMRTLDAFEAKQKDVARARLFDSTNAHFTALSKMAAGDPDGPATMVQAQAQLTALDTEIDARVAAGQISAEEAAKRKQGLRGETLLTLYVARAEKVADPAALATLRQQVRADFTSGKLSLMDGATYEKLDATFDQMGRRKQTEFTAATSAFSREIDDFVERNAKALTPPAGEWEALAAKAAGLGPRGQQMLTEARGRLQIEATMRRMSPTERADYVARLRASVTAAAPGDDAGARLKSKFEARGLAPVQAAALAGHALAESRGNTGAVNPGDGRDGSDSIGLFQWNSDRARRLRAMAAARGVPATDEDLQVDFAMQELATTEKARGDALKAATDVRAASRAVISYLRPAGWSEGDPEAGHNWSGRTAHAERLARGGESAPAAALVGYAEAADKRLTSREKDDPIGAAEQAGIMPGGVAAALDFTAPDKTAQSMRARAIQAQAVAQTSGRPAVYFRPEERAEIKDRLHKGGQAALAVIDGVTAGAGAGAMDALAEIGGDAPELAHAAMIGLQTGDTTLRTRVAAALEARRVPGARPVKPTGETLERAMKDEAGDALRGLSLAQRERVKATAALAYEQMAAQRGVENDDMGLAAEAVRLTLGSAKAGGQTYGGVASYPLGGWFGGAVKVMAPPEVRADRFADVLRALTDADLAALGDPPVRPDGKPMTASELLRVPPLARGGAYLFGRTDPDSGALTPVKSKSGREFVLNWATVAPALRARLPEAFR